MRLVKLPVGARWVHPLLVLQRQKWKKNKKCKNARPAKVQEWTRTWPLWLWTFKIVQRLDETHLRDDCFTGVNLNVTSIRKISPVLAFLNSQSRGRDAPIENRSQTKYNVFKVMSDDEGNNDNYQLGTVAFMKVMIRTCQHVGALIKPVSNY